jgi:hypothetical protein
VKVMSRSIVVLLALTGAAQAADNLDAAALAAALNKARSEQVDATVAEEFRGGSGGP